MSFSETLRMQVKKKASFTCCWCRNIRHKIEVHHITPQAEGGPDTEENAAPLCSNCHTTLGANPELRKEIRARRDNWYELCSKDYVLISRESIQEMLQSALMGNQDRQPSSQATGNVDSKQATQIDQKWRLIYELTLPDEPDAPIGAQALAGWRFVSNSPEPQIALYPGGALGLGAIDNTISAGSPIHKIDDCLVECDIKILGESKDYSRWAGIRIRGLFDDFRLGYLIYLRSDGSIDLHRAEEIVKTTDITYDTAEQWTNFRFEIIDSSITVTVNYVPKITLVDKWFGGTGGIYLHTFETHACFRNLRIFRLKHV